MRRLLLLCALLAACKGSKKEGEPSPSASAKPDEKIGAEEFCKLVFGAAERSLAASCTDAEKGDPAHGYLAERAAAEVKSCLDWIGPDAAAGRVVLPRARAEACATALGRMSWKDLLLGRSPSALRECRGLAIGKQREAEPCRIDASCQDGFYCMGQKSGSEEGSCRAFGRAPAPCDARGGWTLGWVARPSCGEGFHCSAPPPPRRYPLGFDEIDPSTTASPSGATVRNPEELGVGAVSPAVTPRGLDLVLRGEAADDSDPATASSPDSRPGGSGAPAVRLGTTTLAGGLPPEVVQRVVRSSFGRARKCYETARAKNPAAAGTITVTFTIRADGSVGSSDGAGDFPDAAMVSCVARAILQLSFPKPEGAALRVRQDLSFTAGGRSPAGTTPVGSSPPIGTTSASPPEPPTTGPTCIAVQGPCAADADCSGMQRCVGIQCKDVIASIGQPCDDSIDCGAGLYCRMNGNPVPGSPPGGCVMRKKDGESCTSSLQCAGVCGKDGVCKSYCEKVTPSPALPPSGGGR
jgi:hypothetical protein